MTQLTDDDIERCRRALDEDGFVILRDVISKDTLDELCATVDEEYKKLQAGGGLFNGGGGFSGHLNCFPGLAARPAYDEVMASGIVDVIRSAHPEWADRPRVTMNYNLPGSVAQHYHMDGVYTRDFVICNVAVVDTDLVNGALDVLPGTNREFYPFWKYAVERKHRGTTRVPVSKGDMILRRSTTWHRGMPNRSSRPRPMLAVTWGEIDDPTHDPFALNDGAMEFYPNWFRPTRLGRLRERIFVKAPVTYSAYRLARSLYGRKGYAS